MGKEMSKSQPKRSNRGFFVSTSPEYASLLKDKSVKKWISNLKKNAGWRVTVPTFLRTLYKFTKYSGKSPDELIALASGVRKLDQSEELTSTAIATQELAKAFINEMVSSGKRESARHAKTCLMSFFKANAISFEIESIPRVPKKETTILIKEQVYAMADRASSLRNRAIILCIFQSGLGMKALQNLTYEDIKKQFEENRVPIRVRITSRINKKARQKPFYTFFGTEACDALRAYINERKRKIQKMREKGAKVGELKEKSPLFASEGKNVPFGDRMAVSSIWRVIKESAELAGLDKRKIQPNCLIRAFEAELNRSNIDEETKKYLLGNPVHNVKYNVDEVEQKYLVCDFSKTETSKLAIIKEFVQSLGITDIEKEIQNTLKKNPLMTEIEAIKYIVRKELTSRAIKI